MQVQELPSSTECWASRNREVFEHRSRGPARAFSAVWSDLEAIAAANRAVETPFVRAVADGSASPDAIAGFAADLCVITRELPLIEGAMAANATWHSPALVTLLSFGQALATGYFGHPPLAGLADELALRCGVETSSEARVARQSLGSGLSIFLAVMSEHADGGLETSVAATVIDAQWAEVCDVLRTGLREHYDLTERETAVFEMLAGFDGPRTESRPRVLEELAGSGHHQQLIVRAAREASAVWINLWRSWLP